jgi:hypothetical protein
LKALKLGKITYLTIDQVLGAAPKVENIKPWYFYDTANLA